MIKFRQKEFSLLNHVFRGAAIGATTGNATSGITSIFRKKSKEELPKDSILGNPMQATAVGLLSGAALGLVVGIIEEAGNRINHKVSVDRRFMVKVVEDLKRDGFTEGIQFTRDKKLANRMKTKVCLVMSMDSGELNLIINTVADKKLEKLTEEVVNNIPNSSVTNRKMSDRFNEITITTIATGAEVGLLVGIIERFIHSGYPVYMVEVG